MLFSTPPPLHVVYMILKSETNHTPLYRLLLSGENTSQAYIES